jgi:DNA-binding transcriptional ArsR family regulator
MSLLPSSRPDVQADQEGELRLLGFDDETTDAVLDAISSETARAILGEIHTEPQTPSQLATQTDTSLQNVSYHLEKLEAADLIQIAGTQYSEKGREMNVYGPADEPLVMFVGTDERKLGFKQLLKRFIGATSLLAVLSILLHSLIESGLPYVSFTGAGGDGAGGADVVAPTLPLATAIFLGGFVMLSILFAWWYWEPELEAGLTRIWQSPIFGGRNRGLSRRVAIGAVGAFVALGAVWFILAAFQFTLPDLGPVDPLRDGTILLVGIAAIQAYYNDGLLVSWVVVFAPLASVGFLSIGTALAGGSMLSVVGIVGYSVIIGTVGALVLGTGGFLLGASGRRVVAKLSRSLRERNMS